MQLELIEKVEQEAGKSPCSLKDDSNFCRWPCSLQTQGIIIKKQEVFRTRSRKTRLGMSLGQFRNDIFCLGRAPVLRYYKMLLLSLMCVTGVTQLFIYK